MQRLVRVAVEDIAHSSVFTDNRTIEVLLAAEVRAVQSTPLLSSSGELLGVLSTHYRRPRKFSYPELHRLDIVAASACRLIERWAWIDGRYGLTSRVAPDASFGARNYFARRPSPAKSSI